MLFRDQIEPRCIYCQHGTAIAEDTVVCLKKGVMSGGGSCRGFAYDPFKRVPAVPADPDFSKLNDADFSLDVEEDGGD
ncbi:MAG: hypothetical protein LUH16_05345 [Clostridiales bacterium]|nr:hypothetical protein [Clostridiales bacterium]